MTAPTEVLEGKVATREYDTGDFAEVSEDQREDTDTYPDDYLADDRGGEIVVDEEAEGEPLSTDDGSEDADLDEDDEGDDDDLSESELLEEADADIVHIDENAEIEEDQR